MKTLLFRAGLPLMAGITLLSGCSTPSGVAKDETTKKLLGHWRNIPAPLSSSPEDTGLSPALSPDGTPARLSTGDTSGLASMYSSYQSFRAHLWFKEKDCFVEVNGQGFSKPYTIRKLPDSRYEVTCNKDSVFFDPVAMTLTKPGGQPGADGTAEPLVLRKTEQ